MTKTESVAILRRMQEPEAWEPQITAEAFEALDMAIEALEQTSECSWIPEDRKRNLISRQAAYSVLTGYYHHCTEIQHKSLKEALSRVLSEQLDDDFCSREGRGDDVDR